MIITQPFSQLRVYISEKKDGSIDKQEQAKKVLIQNGCKKPIVYFHHLHQAQRFYLNHKQQFSNTIMADAVINHKQRCCLTMKVADCFPIIIIDNKNRVYSLIHGGWKPLFQNILELTVQDMQYKYKLNPKDLSVWIGPGIRSCCYQSKTKPIQADLLNWQKSIKKIKNHWQINLVSFIKDELERLNLQKDKIIDSEICTCCESDKFFSHHKSKKLQEPEARFLVGAELLS